jgi:hypothetical protein
LKEKEKEKGNGNKRKYLSRYTYSAVGQYSRKNQGSTSFKSSKEATSDHFYSMAKQIEIKN